MVTGQVFTRRRVRATEHPVELRFVDMLLIVIATLMFVAIMLSVISAYDEGGSRPNTPPRVMTRSAPAAIVGQPYELTLAVQGGDGDYSWQKARGALPEGMVLGTDGVLRGTPAKQQRTQLSVLVTDGSGRTSAARELLLTVRPAGAGDEERVPPRITSPRTLLDDAVAGREYRHVFEADGGTLPQRWSSTEPPEGLRFAPDGTLVGRPEAGTATFTVEVTDGSGTTARQEVRMVVREGPESLFWRILGWLKTIITYIGYLLVALVVLSWVIGRPPDPGAPPIWEKWKNRG